MPTSTEAKLQAKCVDLARKNNIMVRKVHAENRRGFPDLILIFPINGKTVYVEMKHPNGKGILATLQSLEIKRIRAQNASAYVCHTYKKFTEILTTHLTTDLKA